MISIPTLTNYDKKWKFEMDNMKDNWIIIKKTDKSNNLATHSPSYSPNLSLTHSQKPSSTQSPTQYPPQSLKVISPKAPKST
jgi:hypothetical protein